MQLRIRRLKLTRIKNNKMEVLKYKLLRYYITKKNSSIACQVKEVITNSK
jgi:hypothetical protein